MERTVENVQKLIDEGRSLAKIAKVVNTPNTTMRDWLKSRGMRTNYYVRRWTDDQLVQAVKDNISGAGVLRQLKLSVRSGNYETINKHIRRLRLSTDHFTGRSDRVYEAPVNKRKLSEVLVKESTYSRHNLKRRLLKLGLLINKCSLCNLVSWRDKTLIMVLDHINGINDDNRLENLRMMCPNCNSQQDTFCGRNKKRLTSLDISTD